MAEPSGTITLNIQVVFWCIVITQWSSWKLQYFSKLTFKCVKLKHVMWSFNPSFFTKDHWLLFTFASNLLIHFSRTSHGCKVLEPNTFSRRLCILQVSHRTDLWFTISIIRPVAFEVHQLTLSLMQVWAKITLINPDAVTSLLGTATAPQSPPF